MVIRENAIPSEIKFIDSNTCNSWASNPISIFQAVIDAIFSRNPGFMPLFLPHTLNLVYNAENLELGEMYTSGILALNDNDNSISRRARGFRLPES